LDKRSVKSVEGVVMTEVPAGVIWSLLAGVVNGSFATPTKYTSRWRWENIWAVWAVTALLVVPWVAALATVPRLAVFYRETNPGLLFLLLSLGLGVGVSQIFFGLALAEVGLSIGFAVTIGLSTAIGSIVPLLILDPHVLMTHKGLTVLLGVGLMLAGTALCGVSSNRRDRGKNGSALPARKGSGFGRGLVLCVLAGALSPLMNVALAYGAPMIQRAAEVGIPPAGRTNVVWPLVLTATLVPYLVYCIYLCRKNRSWQLYTAPGTVHYWVLGAVMGILWTGSVILYGYSSTRLGYLGPVLGWPLFMSVMIVTSHLWGIVTGEWKGTAAATLGAMLAGVLLLMLGFCTVAVTSA